MPGERYIDKLCASFKAVAKKQAEEPKKCCGRCKPIGKLSFKDFMRVREEATSVQKGDLYQALKYVGDDPVKSEIEDVLSELLDEETFKQVVAVFKIATRD